MLHVCVSVSLSISVSRSICDLSPFIANYRQHGCAGCGAGRCPLCIEAGDDSAVCQCVCLCLSVYVCVDVHVFSASNPIIITPLV